MRQNYSKKQLQEVIDKYSFGTIEEFRLFMSGFENSNYFVKTNSGPYVVKIFEGRGVAQDTVKFEVNVMDQSFRAGVKSPKIFKNKLDSLTTEWNGKLAVVMNFIEGENAEKQSISEKIVAEIGEQTGKMDKALDIFKNGFLTRQNYEFDGKNFLLLEDKIKYLPKGFNKKYIMDVFSKFRSLKSDFDKLKSGIIHNDVVLHNLLIKEEKLQAIIDFSDMAFSPYIQNIAVAMAQIVFTYNWQPTQAKIFIDGYKKYNSISAHELSMLFDLTGARYATVIVALSYWNFLYGENPERTDSVKDNYGFLLRFLELGKSNFYKLIS